MWITFLAKIFGSVSESLYFPDIFQKLQNGKDTKT